jgi:thioredoxin reductase
VKTNDVVIIGAGPSGISTAIQLRRYNIEPLLLEKRAVGGLLRNANLVENYPGFPKGIIGTELVNNFSKHLELAGVKVCFEEVFELDYNNNYFIVKTYKQTITSRIVVIATGTTPMKITNLSIRADIESYVFYEVYPIINKVGKNIAIIGAGDAAFDYALNLARHNKVTILNRGSKTKCLPLLRERAERNENISYEEDTMVKSIEKHNGKLKLYYSNKNGYREILCSYLLIAIGRKPNLNLISSNLKLNINKLQKSKLLYTIGDIKNNIFRQTSIAVGEGTRAAMEIHEKLLNPI